MMEHLKHGVILTQLSLILLFCMTFKSVAQDTEKEKAVKSYYSGFETHDWKKVASQFADGFTFTTPRNDHISAKEFQDSCWGTNRFFKKVNYAKMVEKNEVLMLLVEINTTDNKVVRNVDVFTFTLNGKIKSIEVFFGAGTKYPGNSN
jgi:hypothetical protein